MKKVSIVIPVYNNEKTVEKAIFSVLSQNFDNLEIVVVDDGSGDNSFKICCDAASRDGRVKVIHTENFGTASARNTGLSAAGGKYIMFLDGDDFYCVGAVAKMVEKIEKTGCDIVSGGITKVAADGGTRRINPGVSGVYDSEKMPDIHRAAALGRDGALISFVDKIYSADFLRRNNIVFPPLCSGEDSAFAFKALLCADSVAFIDDFPFYSYVENSASFTKKRISVENRILYSDKFYGEMEKIIEKFGADELQSCLSKRKALSVYDFVMCAASDKALSRRQKLAALEYIASSDYYISDLSDDKISEHKKYVRAVCVLMRSFHIGAALLLADIIRLVKKIVR